MFTVSLLSPLLYKINHYSWRFLLLHPLGVVFNLVGPEDQLVRAAVKLVRNHLLEMLEDRDGNARSERSGETAAAHFKADSESK